MKIGIVFNQHKLSGWLTNLFTGCYAYHSFWVDEQNGVMYEMNLIRRRRHWPKYYSNDAQVYLSKDFPEVTSKFMESKLTMDENRYGVVDYCLFMLRPLFHLFGKSTRNAGGVICSEMNVLDMLECGISLPWTKEDPPPSPCELHRFLKDLQ
jgi:hypothetical protein